MQGVIPSGMRVYLVRHGKAEKTSPTGRDPDRPLRPKGIRQCGWLSEQLLAMKKRPSVILASPYVRALDTARILHRGLRCALRVEDALAADRDTVDVFALLRSLALPAPGRAAEKPPEALAIVGHNPILSELVTMLVKDPAEWVQPLRTGECAILDLPAMTQDDTMRACGKLVNRLRMKQTDEDE